MELLALPAGFIPPGTHTIRALPDRSIFKPTDSALDWENPEVRVYIGPGLCY